MRNRPQSPPARAAWRGRPRCSRPPPALSRIAGLIREIVAASYFGITAQMSAFTIAFQVPNLVRSLFADAAIQAAFVPVFTEQLEQGNRREAFRLASSLIFLVTADPGRSHRALHPARARHHAPLHPGSVRGRERPDRFPLAHPLPDHRPPRHERDGRRHPQLLRPLRRLRDRAVLLERRDHRRPGRPRAGVPGGRRDLRLRDRRPCRHHRATRDSHLGPQEHPIRPSARLPRSRQLQPSRTGTTRTSAASSS